jgi:hypothetical protein
MGGIAIPSTASVNCPTWPEFEVCFGSWSCQSVPLGKVGLSRRAIYILEGTFEVVVGGEPIEAEPSSAI